MAPKPIWGAITSYFYPEEPVEEHVTPYPVPNDGDQVDEDGWMLVGPKRAPTPDADEVGSVVLVSSESDSEAPPSAKRPCDNEVAQVPDNGRVAKHMKQLSVIEQMLFEQTATNTAINATQPKNSWKARNTSYNKGKAMRIRHSTRNPGRRSC